MAITIPIVTEFRDAGLRNAQREVDTFAGRIEKRLGKFGMVAAGAGAAIGGFAVKSVMQFKNLALEAGNFADATGIAVEEASRWVDLAGDMGISATSIETAIMRMNKTLGTSEKAFEDLGIEVVRTSNGVIDSNATFQRAVTAVGAIVDPTERARAAQELFGKSYADIARIMEMSAGELVDRLGEVPKANLVDQRKLDQARRLNQSLEDLKGVAEELTLTLGSALAPAFTVAAEAATNFLNKLRELREDDFWGPFLRTLPEWLSWYKQEFKDTFGIDSQETLESHAGSFYTLEEAMAMFESRVTQADYDRLEKELEMAATAAERLDTAMRSLQNKISEQKAWKDFDETLFYFRADMFVSREEALKFAEALAGIIDNIDSIDPETKIKLITELEGGELDEVLRKLEILRQGVKVPIRPSPTNVGLPGPMWSVPGLAVGGQAKAGKPYMVGERGPELFVPTGSGRVIPNDQLGGAGMTVNITTSEPSSCTAAATGQHWYDPGSVSDTGAGVVRPHRVRKRPRPIRPAPRRPRRPTARGRLHTRPRKRHRRRPRILHPRRPCRRPAGW